MTRHASYLPRTPIWFRATGARPPVGLDAPNGAAAMRAGISAPAEPLVFVDRNSGPRRLACDVLFGQDARLGQRLAALASAALNKLPDARPTPEKRWPKSSVSDGSRACLRRHLCPKSSVPAPRPRPGQQAGKRTFCALWLGLLIASGGHAAVAVADPAAVVSASERKWAAALVSKDMPTLARLLDPAFRLVTLYSQSSSDIDRLTYLEMQVSDPARAFKSMTPVAIDVEVHGALALAFVDMNVGWPDGLKIETEYRFTDVWALRDGRWLVVSRFSEHRAER